MFVSKIKKHVTDEAAVLVCDLFFQMEGDEEIEGELRDEGEQQDSPDDSQVSLRRNPPKKPSLSFDNSFFPYC